MSTEGYLGDLRRRLDRAHRHVDHLRAILREQSTAAHRGNEMAGARLDSLEAELKAAEIDADRLQSLLIGLDEPETVK